MPLYESPKLNYVPMGDMGLVRASEIHPNGNGRLADSADAYVRSNTGLFVPPHSLSSDRMLPTELTITIDFAQRAKERPKEYKEYMKTTPDGEPRFDFENRDHTAAMNYADVSYSSFQVNVDESLREHAEGEGITIDQLKAKMMAGRSIVDSGTLLVPFNHHMPNKGEGHYDGDFFYWDNKWSGTWARINNDLPFAKGVMDDFQYEYNAVGYVPNSNKIKISDRSQPPILPLLFNEVAQLLTDSEEDNQWRKEKVSFMKSEYFQVWVADSEGEALYDTYNKKGKKKSSLWKNQSQTPTGLSRYSCADITANKYAGEAATGEDVGPRFKGEPEKYNPTDLAGLRGIAQKVFRDEALREGNAEEANYWNIQFEKTKELVNELMWDEEKGWYMDYNFEDGKKGEVMALAAVMLVKAELVPEDRRNRMMDNYDKFALPYGMAVTSGEEPTAPGREGKESWKGPNRWAPREDIYFDAFMPYSEHHPVLEELMMRSQIGTAQFHKTWGTMPEVLDGVTGEIGGSALYPRRPTDEGFLWTCVTYLENDRRLKEIYALRDEQKNETYDSEQIVFSAQLVEAS